MISPAEMRVLDRNAQYFGVSILELMENAGKAVADAARSEFGAAGKTSVPLSWSGKTRGHGLLDARRLTTGARRTVRHPGTPPRHRAPDRGEIVVPTKVARMGGPGEFTLSRARRATSHKGQNGRVLVIAGGPYTGAPALVGYGALGVGADLIHVATPALAASVVASYSPMFIVHPLVGHRLLREDTRQIVDLSARADAIAIGPGLGDAEGTLDAVKEIVRSVSLPLVVDADAVRPVATDPKCLVGKRALITPHSREFQTLTGKTLPDAPDERAEIVREAAKAFGATILLNGHIDIVTDAARARITYTATSSMTCRRSADGRCV